MRPALRLLFVLPLFVACRPPQAAAPEPELAEALTKLQTLHGQAQQHFSRAYLRSPRPGAAVWPRGGEATIRPAHPDLGF